MKVGARSKEAECPFEPPFNITSEPRFDSNALNHGPIQTLWEVK